MGKGSSHVGVVRRGRKWHATIGTRGKRKFLGSFQSEEEAAEAVRQARLADPRVPGNTSSSKYTGVYQLKGSLSFESRISVDGKNVYLGTFPTEEAAAKRYLAAMTQYQKERKASGVYWGDNKPQTVGPVLPAALPAAATAAVPAPSPAGQEAPQRSKGNDARKSRTTADVSSASMSHYPHGVQHAMAGGARNTESVGAEVGGATASSQPFAPILPPVPPSPPSSQPPVSISPSMHQGRRLSNLPVICLPWRDAAACPPQQSVEETVRTLPAQEGDVMMGDPASAGTPLKQLRGGSAGAAPGQKQDSRQNHTGPFADPSSGGTGTAAGVGQSTQQGSGTLPAARQAQKQQAGQAPGVGAEQRWGHTAMLQSLGCGTVLTGRRALQAEKARIAYLRVLLDNRQEELEELHAVEMDL